MSEVTLKQFVKRAYELVAESWIQGTMFRIQDDEGGYSDDDQLEDLVRHRDNLIGVCSIGAMQVAFADVVGMPVFYEGTPGGDDYMEWTDEGAVIAHPLYQQGMRVLGEAFYASEQLRDLVNAGKDPADIVDEEYLLDGKEGRPYGVSDVETAVIRINDATPRTVKYEVLHSEIVAAFKRATEAASETVTAAKLEPQRHE